MNKLEALKKKATAKKTDNKGFTLVEIIVVLVILTILMAALVPSMIGFVNEARGKAYVTEARSAYIALQSKVTEKYALNNSYNSTSDFTGEIASSNLKDIMEGSYTTGATVTSYTLTGSKVTQMVYTVGGYKITIAPGATAVIEKTATAPVTP